MSFDYSKLVSAHFNLVLDVTENSSGLCALNNELFATIKEYFALAEDRLAIFSKEESKTLFGFKMSSERIQQLISFLSVDDLIFSKEEENERTILIFK